MSLWAIPHSGVPNLEISHLPHTTSCPSRGILMGQQLLAKGVQCPCLILLIFRQLSSLRGCYRT